MAYSFQTTPEGNIQTSQDGKVISTGTAQSASQQYGYQAPATAGTAAPVNTTPTPTVISSNDSAGQFQTNSTNLTDKTANTNTTVYTAKDGSGNTLYYTVGANGQVQYQNAPGGSSSTPATGFNADGTPKTAVDKGAAAGAGTGAEPNVSTGNPILDSLQQWEQSQDANAQANADAQKAQVAQMLQTNLAANDSQAAATIQGIQNTYAGLIDTQNRINALNINRTKAYGLASGNALATPLEFTNAVSQKETEAMTQIQNLDNSRDSAIASAKAAQASGDAKLLQDSMDEVDKIESDMQTTLANLANEVTNRASVLNQVETQQKADQAAQSQKLLAAAVGQYGTDYAALTDPTKQDQMIKSIVASSGGLLDYGSVYSSLQNAAATATAAKTQAAKDASSLALQAAQTTEAKASAAKSYADASKSAASATPGEVFGAIDKLLGTKDSSGMPYIQADTGYFTKGGYQTLLNAAGENGVNKAAFLAQYGGYIDPNAYASYGLTKSDQDSLTNTNKTTPIVLPVQTTQSGG